LYVCIDSELEHIEIGEKYEKALWFTSQKNEYLSIKREDIMYFLQVLWIKLNHITARSTKHKTVYIFLDLLFPRINRVFHFFILFIVFVSHKFVPFI